MIRFYQTFGAHAGRTVEFEQDVVTFGRMPTCDIAFDPKADLDASGEHAQVKREQGVWHVLDANSRNGTWLNGRRIMRAPLATGDELEFGRGGPRLRVELVEPRTQVPLSFAATELAAPLPPVFRSRSVPASTAAPASGARERSVRPPPARGLGLGVAVLVGVMALLFAALAVGVLIWRLLSVAETDSSAGPRSSVAGLVHRVGW